MVTTVVNQNQALPPSIRIVPEICGSPAVKNGLRERTKVKTSRNRSVCRAVEVEVWSKQGKAG